MLLTITPILYIPATFVVVSRIFSKLFGEFRDKHVNLQLLGVISLSNFMVLKTKIKIFVNTSILGARFFCDLVNIMKITYLLIAS